MKPLCLVFGVPGSGKSTIASETQKICKDVVILDIDDVAQAAVVSGAEPSIGYTIAFRHLANFLNRNSNAAFPVIICAALSRPERWDSIIQTLDQQTNFSASFIQLVCDPDLAFLRASTRQTIQAIDNGREKIRGIAAMHDCQKCRFPFVRSFRNETDGDAKMVVTQLEAFFAS